MGGAETGGLTFHTLKAFVSSLETCEVTAKNGARLTLLDGLGAGVALIQGCRRRNKKVALIGNGGSAAIASHQAVDLWKNSGVRAIAFNDAAMLTCVGNDFGYAEVFAKPIRMFLEAGDLLVAVSSSGQSENILRGVAAARDQGCEVVSLSGFAEHNLLRQQGDLNFYLPSASYGIVETGHLLLLHAMIDELKHAR